MVTSLENLVVFDHCALATGVGVIGWTFNSSFTVYMDRIGFGDCSNIPNSNQQEDLTLLRLKELMLIERKVWNLKKKPIIYIPHITDNDVFYLVSLSFCLKQYEEHSLEYRDDSEQRIDMEVKGKTPVASTTLTSSACNNWENHSNFINMKQQSPKCKTEVLNSWGFLF
jgi:hypothetical protein